MREKPSNPIMDRFTLDPDGLRSPSKRTQSWLRRTSYRGEEEFDQLLMHARGRGQNGDRESLHSAAEVSYLAAERSRKRDPELAAELFLDAVRYSWLFTVRTLPSEGVTGADQTRYRETTEIYNTSLEQLLRLTHRVKELNGKRVIRMPLSGRTLQFEVPFQTQWMSADQLGAFEFVSDFELTNLRKHHRRRGLGVPLMVKRKRNNAAPDLEKYYATDLSLPVTAVARFDTEDDIRIQLFDPRESDGIAVDNRLYMLESDLSAPLAWFLTDPEKGVLDTLGLFRPDKARRVEGLYMVTPYDPDRIPVLMVHGLWSSPITWMEMFNDLQADPELREKYQFWFYLYPTGEPLTTAAANLRERLREVRRRCDPYGRNRTLDQMVVVGHSMGGLMSYLLTVNSEDKLWNALSEIPVDKIEGGPEIQDEVRRVFFFESDRSVDRIITIASPFSGSGFANKFTQWLSGSIISLPDVTSQLSEQIFHQNNQSLWDRMFAPRTSLDSLSSNSAILSLVRHTSTPPDVIHHNVVGVCTGRKKGDWSDGVVKYTSASRSDVESEIVVEACHSAVHRHEETIREVARILREHLRQTGRHIIVRGDENSNIRPASEGRPATNVAP
ncbi:MAG TPA: hypothetical protein DCG12_23605 [Planctomycetaceae bacterium]|nr:hypothetical protein [Planctomycetaceae bacterium]